MLNLNSLMIGSADPKALITFYEKVLGEKPSWSDGEWAGFSAGDSSLAIGPHDKVRGKATQPERIIINFETDDVKGEFERVKKIGAKVIAEPYEGMSEGNGWIATFADPDGNYFQLTSPWSE